LLLERVDDRNKIFFKWHHEVTSTGKINFSRFPIIYTRERKQCIAWWQFSLYIFNFSQLRSSLISLFQMKPTRCTLRFSMFISTSLHVSGNYVPIIRRTYRIYATLAVWSAAADQTATLTQWKIPVSHRYGKFSWWRAHSCPKHVQKFK